MMWNYQENIQIFHQINTPIDASWPTKNIKCFLVKGKYDQGTMLGGNNNLSAHRS